MTVLYVFLALLLLGVMILVHEMGHYLVGRACGLGIEEFSIGFGPRLLGWRRGKIDYSIRAIPLGGYVHFTGEDEENPDENAFNNHPVWKRFLTTLAGAVMNFLLAFVALVLLFSLYGVSNVPALSDIEPGSPAEMAGLMPGDRVISVDGAEISNDQDGFDQMYALFSARKDETPFLLGIERGGETFEVSISKAQNADGEWLLGVMLGETKRIGFGTAIVASGETFVDMSTMLLDFLRDLIFRGEGADQVMGTVGTIGEVSRNISKGFDMILNMLAVISMNLGIMNLLPLPALDGGRLVFLAIEGIFRKPVPRDKEAMVHVIGMVALFGLMIVLTYSDIMKMIGR